MLRLTQIIDHEDAKLISRNEKSMASAYMQKINGHRFHEAQTRQ